MKKIRYSRGIKYIPIGLFIFFECIVLISSGLSTKNFIDMGIFVLLISVPIMICELRNCIKYDNERIYFYKFAFLTKTIEMYNILYLQIIEVYGRGGVSEYLSTITRENKRYKFKISHLNSEDIACMEAFIEKQYLDVKILPTNRTSTKEILNDKIKRLHNKFL